MQSGMMILARIPPCISVRTLRDKNGLISGFLDFETAANYGVAIYSDATR